MPEDFINFFEQHNYRLHAIGRNWCSQITRTTWPGCSDIWAVPMPGGQTEIVL